MAAPGSAISAAFEGVTGSASGNTQALLAAMLKASDKVSDLIFSPGRPPQVEVYGQLMTVQVPGISVLSADDTTASCWLQGPRRRARVQPSLRCSIA